MVFPASSRTFLSATRILFLFLLQVMVKSTVPTCTVQCPCLDSAKAPADSTQLCAFNASINTVEKMNHVVS